MFSPDDLVLIRHAAADHQGRLCGRTDVGLAPDTKGPLQRLAPVLTTVTDLRVSPALRCRLTADALWPGTTQAEDDRLWEQDFGDWEGLPFTDLPDLGVLSPSDLAARTPPGGESFLDLAARVTPALKEAARAAREQGPVVVVAHAGVVRAGISMALAHATAGLSFEIAPLSITRIGCLETGFSVRAANWNPA